MKFNITKGTIGTVGKVVGTALVYGLASMVSSKSTRDMVDNIRYSGNASYSDAVGVIMDSDMLDSYKNEAIGLLKKNSDAEYYKTVIKIVKSDMLGSSRVKAITNIGEEES